MSKKIGIASIWPLDETSFAGTEIFVYRLGKSLIEAGYSVECISPATTNNYKGISHIPLTISISNVNEKSIKKQFTKEGVAGTIQLFSDSLTESIRRAGNYDFIILNSPLFSRYKGLPPCMMILHDNPNELINYFGNKNSELVLDILKEAIDYPVVTPSNHYKEYYSNILNVKVDHIPHALEPTFISGDIVERVNKYKCNNQEISILIPSRLEPNQKGQDMAISAISKLSESTKSTIHLKLSGLDPIYNDNRDRLIEEAVKTGISIEVCKYLNIINEMIIADIILLPSRYESFGYAAQEGISLGKQVVLSNIPTYIEIAEDAPNAHLFESNSVSSLTNILSQVLESKPTLVYPPSNWYDRYSVENWLAKYIKYIKDS